MAGVGVAVTVTDGVVRRARASFVSVTDVPAVLDLEPALGGRRARRRPRGTRRSTRPRRRCATTSSPRATSTRAADYRAMLVAELTRRTLAQAAAPRRRPAG